MHDDGLKITTHANPRLKPSRIIGSFLRCNPSIRVPVVIHLSPAALATETVQRIFCGQKAGPGSLKIAQRGFIPVLTIGPDVWREPLYGIQAAYAY